MRRAAQWLFRDRRTGRITVAQFPNLPLALFVVCRAVEWIGHPGGRVGDSVQWIGTAGLLWWALAELSVGVNPFRRIIGAVVIAAVIATLV